MGKLYMEIDKVGMSRNEELDDNFVTYTHGCTVTIQGRDYKLPSGMVKFIDIDAHDRALLDALKGVCGMTWHEKSVVFGSDCFADILAMDANKIVNRYQEFKNPVYRVGDEVYADSFYEGVITNIDKDGLLTIVMKKTGRVQVCNPKDVIKNGEHFDSVERYCSK